MNELTKCLVVSTLLLSSCSWKPEKEVVTVEKVITPTIAIAQKTKPIKMAEAPKEPTPVVEEEPVIDSFEANPDPDGSDMPILPPRTPTIRTMPQAPGIQDPKKLEKTRMDIAQLPKDDILIS